MTGLSHLFELSRKSDLLTFEATVDTGFEALAARECLNKFGPDTDVCYERGRIYVNLPISQYHLVKDLRSINNFLLVAGVLKNISLSPAEANNLEKDLAIIGRLVDNIEWRKYLDAWKQISSFNGNLYPTREQYLEAVSKISEQVGTRETNSPELNGFSDENPPTVDSKTDILRYRVTCYRSGKHSFGSQDAARSFGGQLQDMFQWIVNLDDYQLEIIFDITSRDAVVLIALTKSSLHKRNLSHFGLTTLRSTISYNLLQIAEPKVGEIIMDPFCGSGSIPMEGAIGFPGTYHLCGDIEEKSIELVSLNRSTYAENYNHNLLIDTVHWDVCALPLKNSCIDIMVTDLPFGRRVGSKSNNRTLYSNALRELARVVRPSSGRIVLLTADRTAYTLGFQCNKRYFKQMKSLGIKFGGLKACVYLLIRTALDYR